MGFLPLQLPGGPPTGGAKTQGEPRAPKPKNKLELALRKPSTGRARGADRAAASDLPVISRAPHEVQSQRHHRRHRPEAAHRLRNDIGRQQQNPPRAKDARASFFRAGLPRLVMRRSCEEDDALALAPVLQADRPSGCASGQSRAAHDLAGRERGPRRRRSNRANRRASPSQETNPSRTRLNEEPLPPGGSPPPKFPPKQVPPHPVSETSASFAAHLRGHRPQGARRGDVLRAQRPRRPPAARAAPAGTDRASWRGYGLHWTG